MKKYVLLFLLLFLSSTLSAQPTAETMGASKPVLTLPESSYTFPPVIDGKIITHTFPIKNSGDAPLYIDKVETTCGCTTADYSKEISVGDTGHVTIQFNTKGYGGQETSKTAKISSNDPLSNQTTIELKGRVDVFARIEPKSVTMTGSAGETVQTVVHITPTDLYPFIIVGDPVCRPEKFHCLLEKRDDGYALTVEAVKKTAGKYFDKILLKTDHPDNPEISILVFCTIR